MKYGQEFGSRENSITISVRTLYRLTTSAERFCMMLADFLRTLNFISSCFDRDVWTRIRDDDTGYNYIRTHVDDFKVITKDPFMWIDHIAAVF